jgi:dihydroorotate dehydrogenase
MTLYESLRPLLFRLEPEHAHAWSLKMLALLSQTGIRFASAGSTRPRRVMGLEFPNPVGLAAGMDKNGDYIDALAGLGFGFIEIGTVTPRPQAGNPKPRLFRLPAAQAIINRMGFNNRGVDYLVERLKKTAYQGILGVNIGKNADTPVERAVDDYLTGFRKVYPYASYVALNVSSPNTPNLRQLQSTENLRRLLTTLKAEQSNLRTKYERYTPLVVKLAPDLSSDEIGSIVALLLELGIDGVIATNTTVSRDEVFGLPGAEETGGLSGRPLKQKADRVLMQLAAELRGRVPIIGVGGIFGADDAVEKMQAGASLVQIYSGLIYRGPGLIREINAAIGRAP